MAQFDLITNSKEALEDSLTFDAETYHIDTAAISDVREWISFNGYADTYCFLDGFNIGYFNLLPVHSNVAALFERQEMGEQDIRPEHILAPDVMRYAQYFYLPSISVKNHTDYRSRQAVAALVVGIASYLLNVFTPERIKRIYASPTTFQGNTLLHRLGFKPVGGVRKLLTSSDIYYIDVTTDTISTLHHLRERYARFVRSNCWEDPALLALLSGSSI